MSKTKNYNDAFKWERLEGIEITSDYDMPIVQAVNDVQPRNLVSFNNAKYCKDKGNSWYHFYIHDTHFERFWKDPDKYLLMLSQFEGGISTDFSLYLDMPWPQQVYNSWRNKYMACLLQKQGKPVIPNVGWSDESSYDWAFSGIPENSVLSITTQGCLRDRVCKQSLFNGLHELVRRKHPTKIIVYGVFHEGWMDKFGVEFEIFPSYSREKWGDNNG